VPVSNSRFGKPKLQVTLIRADGSKVTLPRSASSLSEAKANANSVIRGWRMKGVIKKGEKVDIKVTTL